MPQESQLAHRVLNNLALPYISNVSPANTDPHFVAGSSDILTSINSYAERRPGFATPVESTPTVFNNLQRTFTWDRFDGTFFVMFCNINAGNLAEVYKYQIGLDTSAVLIFTDVTSTPLDFVVSNNTVYFSNGSVAKKWDPVNGISNWGISIFNPSSNVSAYAGTGSGSGWTNPANIAGPPDGVYASAISQRLFPSSPIVPATYGFSIPSTNIIVGIQVAITGHWTVATGAPLGAAVLVQLSVNGSPVGNQKSAQLNKTTDTTLTLGGSNDLWGTTFTAAVIDATTFGLSIKGLDNPFPTSSHSVNIFLDSAQITVFETGGPVISVAGGAGSMTATAGYTYVYCYGNSATGHISSPTLPSASTGVFTNKANVNITLVASTDPQVNQIRVFRTTDGGGGIYFELPTSPYPNTSMVVTDSVSDTGLNVSSIAPTATFNDPPTPGRGATYFAGRIHLFNGNKLYFSGLEEINQGVPEESFPSGTAGNFWSFDEPVQGQGVAGIGQNQTLGVLCGGRLFGITGTTLDTFQRMLVSTRRGCRSLASVSVLGGMLAWLDSANQIWATDGQSLNELSPMIRPDIAGVTPANCSLTFHTAGRFHWLVFSTGAKLFVYDVDLDQWMPPWNFAATYISSGEISPGNYVLMATNGTKALQMNPNAFNDNGVTYAPNMTCGLLSVVPDFGTRFSYIGMGSYNEPTRTGVPWTFQVTNNGKTLGDFKILTDEDPTQGTFTSIASNLVDTATAFNRTNGTFLKQLVYQVTQPASRWVSMQVILANADQVDKIYELFMAYKPLGGR